MIYADENDTDHEPNKDRKTWERLDKASVESTKAEIAKSGKHDTTTLDVDGKLRLLVRMGGWWYCMGIEHPWRCPDVTTAGKCDSVSAE